MCGRYAITATAERIEQVFDALWETASIDAERGAGAAALAASLAAVTLPRFNVAPTQMCPVVRAGADTSEARDRSTKGGGRGGGETRIVSMMRWGLVPSWADDPAIGNRLINARVETAPSKPSFRSAWKKGRCLVPISHFYEWKKEGSRKQPMAIRAAGEDDLLALAGLWDSWRDGLRSFTILTTEPNELLRSIHDRMPLILPPERWSRWLDPGWSGPDGAEELAEWSKPAPKSLLRAYAVATTVNSPRNDSPECVAPVVA
ncbi:MAG: SOS response-associated peptidase [Phycisphaerae bacterium]|nr:SOS response-associated peptidase [Phycisphaerae bacterium]